MPCAPADDFAAKRACVVGGTSGIGAAIASALIARGAEDVRTMHRTTLEGEIPIMAAASLANA